MRTRSGIVTSMTAFLLLLGVPAWACGFLIAPNGAVRLGKTVTLAAYVDGIEHYVTSFEYQGGGAAFGSIVPLPGIPDVVERAGSWTLQRLQREVAPPPPADEVFDAVGLSSSEAVVLQEVEVDALDITILEGGGQAVLDWAVAQGFDLGEGAAEMLSFYADRSPYFMAARFDVDRAAEFAQTNGDGTPIHLAIPTDDPWVPLRILGFDKPGQEIVEADIFLLTPRRPGLLPLPHEGLYLEHSAPATDLLLDDLRDDENSAWVPTSAWLTYLRLAERADRLTYDLAVAADGGAPSPVAAGAESGTFEPGAELDALLIRAADGATAGQILAVALGLLLAVGAALLATGIVGPASGVESKRRVPGAADPSDRELVGSHVGRDG